MSEFEDLYKEQLAELLSQLQNLHWRPGDAPLDWLERNLGIFLMELGKMALAPTTDKSVPAKVKLEALKELISRPLPAKNIYEVLPGSSQVDRMTDDEVKKYIECQLKRIPETTGDNGDEENGGEQQQELEGE